MSVLTCFMVRGGIVLSESKLIYSVALETDVFVE